MEKEVFMKQNYKISDENRSASKMCASATEHVPKNMEEKSAGNDSKVNHNAWIQLKKCVPTMCFTKSKNKEEHDDENDKCNMLIDVKKM